MPLTNNQARTLAAIKQEFVVLIATLKSTSPLSAFIGSQESNELLNATNHLQKICALDDELQPRNNRDKIDAILNLFPSVTGPNKRSLQGELPRLESQFVTKNDDAKKEYIRGFKQPNNIEIEDEIKYIYFRIIYREDDIISLAKYKQLTDAIGKDENVKNSCLVILKEKVNSRNKEDPILLTHLNNLLDSATLKEIKLKKRQLKKAVPATGVKLPLDTTTAPDNSSENSTLVSSTSDEIELDSSSPLVLVNTPPIENSVSTETPTEKISTVSANELSAKVQLVEVKTTSDAIAAPVNSSEDSTPVSSKNDEIELDSSSPLVLVDTPVENLVPTEIAKETSLTVATTEPSNPENPVRKPERHKSKLAQENWPVLYTSQLNLIKQLKKEIEQLKSTNSVLRANIQKISSDQADEKSSTIAVKLTSIITNQANTLKRREDELKNEKTELSCKLQLAQQQLTELQTSSAESQQDLNSQLTEKEHSLRSSNDSIERLRSELAENKKKQDALSQEKQQSENSVTTLTQQLEEKSQAVATLIQQQEQHSTENKQKILSLEKTLEQLTKEIELNKTSEPPPLDSGFVSITTAESSQSTDLQKKPEQLQEKDKFHETELESLKKQLEKNKTALNSLQQQSSAAKTQHDAAQHSTKEKAKQLESQLQKATQQSSQLKNQIQQLQTQCTTLQNDQHTATTALQSTLQSEKAKQEKLTQELAAVTKQCNSFLSEAKNILSTTNTDSFYSLTPPSEFTTESEFTKEFARILEKMELFKEETNRVKQQVEGLKTNIGELENKNFTLESAAITTADSVNEAAQLRAEKETLEIQIEELQKHLNEEKEGAAFLGRILATLYDSNQNYETSDSYPQQYNLATELEFDEDDSEGKSRSDDSDDEKEDNYLSFTATKGKLVETQVSLKNIQAELEEKITQLTKLEQQLATQTGQNENLSQTCTELDKEKNAQSANNLLLLDSKNSLEQQLEQEKDTSKQIQEKLLQLQETFIRTKQHAEKLQQEKNELQDELNSQKTDSDRQKGCATLIQQGLEKKLEKKNEALEMLKNKLADLALTQETLLERIATLVATKESLEELNQVLIQGDNMKEQTTATVDHTLIKQGQQDTRPPSSNLFDSDFSEDDEESPFKQNFNSEDKSESTASSRSLSSSSGDQGFNSSSPHSLKDNPELNSNGKESPTTSTNQGDPMPTDKKIIDLLNSDSFKAALTQALTSAIESKYTETAKNILQTSSLDATTKTTILALKQAAPLTTLITQVTSQFNDDTNNIEIPVELNSALTNLVNETSAILTHDKPAIAAKIVAAILSNTDNDYTNSTQALKKALEDSKTLAENIANNYVLTIEALKTAEPHSSITQALFDTAYATAKQLFNADIPGTAFNTKLKEEIKPYARTLTNYLLSNEGIGQLATMVEKYTAQMTDENLSLGLSHLTTTLIPTLTIGETDIPLKTLLENLAKATLCAACADHLVSTVQQDNYLKTIKESVATALTQLSLNTGDNSTTNVINNIANNILSTVFKPANLQAVLQQSISSIDTSNSTSLVQLAANELLNQGEKLIGPKIEEYFPAAQRTLNKIQAKQLLSTDELNSLDPALQYAHSPQDFSLGLQASHPNADFSSITPANFTKARHLLREQALTSIKNNYTDADEIAPTDNLDTFSAETWLAKKYQLITGKVIDLTLPSDTTEKLTKEFNKLFQQLSPLELAAVTQPSVEELNKELEKLNNLNLLLVKQHYQQFTLIEEKFLAYLELANIKEFMANLNIKLSIEYPENNPKLEINETQTKNLLKIISQHIKDDISKWSLLTTVNGALINEIFADPKLNFTVNNNDLAESDTKKIIGTALLVLSKHHGLADTLNKRKLWEESIKLPYAKAGMIANFRQQIADRVTKLKDMKNTKALSATASNTAGPGVVYLPKDCKVIDNSEVLTGASATVSGSIFQRRDELRLNQTVTYKQTLNANKQQIWSVTRITEDCLEYRTPGKSNACYKDFGKAPEEVTFTQMIDAVNSFKNSTIIHFSFADCSKDLEKKYRLFISAYNELKVGPTLYCKPNDSIKMQSADLEAAKDEIKAKLQLHTDEIDKLQQKLPQFAKDNSPATQLRSRG